MRKVVLGMISAVTALSFAGCKEDRQKSAHWDFDARVELIKAAKTQEEALRAFSHLIGSIEAQADPERIQRLARSRFDGDYERIALGRLAMKSTRCDPSFFREILDQTPRGSERASLIHRGLSGLPAEETMRLVSDLSAESVDSDTYWLCRHFEGVPNALPQLNNSDLKKLLNDIEGSEVLKHLDDLLQRRLKAGVGEVRPRLHGVGPTA